MLTLVYIYCTYVFTSVTCETVNSVLQILTVVNTNALARPNSSCKRQTRPRQKGRPTSTNPQLSGLGPQIWLDTKSDWPTDRQS
jgi:hypothetical protein